MSDDQNINNQLLQWVMRHTADGHTPATTHTAEGIPPRDPRDYEFLREAMRSVEAMDRRTKTLLDQIEKDGADKTKSEEVIAALDELQEFIEDMNVATEFMLMKGHLRFMKLLCTLSDIANSASSSSDNDEDAAEIRRLIALTLAHSAQNYEKMQTAFHEGMWYDVVVDLLRKEKDKGVRSALLLWVNNTCRAHDLNTVAFIKATGLDVISAIIRDHYEADPGSVKRCLRFLNYVVASHGICPPLMISQAAAILADSSAQDEEASNHVIECRHSAVCVLLEMFTRFKHSYGDAIASKEAETEAAENENKTLTSSSAAAKDDDEDDNDRTMTVDYGPGGVATAAATMIPKDADSKRKAARDLMQRIQLLVQPWASRTAATICREREEHKSEEESTVGEEERMLVKILNVAPSE